MNADQLIAFEDRIRDDFNAGRITAPVHFAGGNEQQLIDLFAHIEPNDWVLCSWRSHYHCLLKGVPPEQVRDAILAGRSIALCFPEYRVLSSAIVGGICPIAVGLAWAIKRNNGCERVHVFIGDMTAESGLVHECSKYAVRHALPVHWIIEDNLLSVCTETKKAWGEHVGNSHLDYYTYQLSKPHVGTGKFVRF